MRIALCLTVLAAALAACDRDERVAASPPDPAAAVAAQPPGAIAPAGAGLAAGDEQFLAQAVESSQFQFEIARLALEKSADPSVKSFAQMLVADHAAATAQLRRIATGHGVALPAALPEERKHELEQLAALSGPAFDREFVRRVGIHAEFEKASQAAQAPDVRLFAQGALPTLQKHLEAAQQLPAKG